MVTIANPPPRLRAGPLAENCAVEKALVVVGAKWTLIVLHHLMDGPKRFGDLQRLIPSASPKMLTVRLRDLETSELVEYEVVGATEGYVGHGRVSVEAPVGRALIGTVAGDFVSVACPRGELRFEVVGVETSAPSTREAA